MRMKFAAVLKFCYVAPSPLYQRKGRSVFQSRRRIPRERDLSVVDFGDEENRMVRTENGL